MSSSVWTYVGSSEGPEAWPLAQHACVPSITRPGLGLSEFRALPFLPQVCVRLVDQKVMQVSHYAVSQPPRSALCGQHYVIGRGCFSAF
jgi:hypothetical protein